MTATMVVGKVTVPLQEPGGIIGTVEVGGGVSPGKMAGGKPL